MSNGDPELVIDYFASVDRGPNYFHEAVTQTLEEMN